MKIVKGFLNHGVTETLRKLKKPTWLSVSVVRSLALLQELQ